MSSSRTTLVCFAVKQEAGHFRRLTRARPDIEVLLTGMGRFNAEKSLTQAIARQKPGLVVTAGFAGGLDPQLPLGTVVFEADESTGLVPALRQAGARPAKFHCAENVIATAAEKRVLYSQTGAEVVEMESLVIRDWCRNHQVPVAIVRVVLDTAAEDLVLDFNQLMTGDMRIDPAKLAFRVMSAPWKIPALLQLQKQTAAAATILGDILNRIL
jgi:adenosylhomocysteine nucleosidase